MTRPHPPTRTLPRRPDLDQLKRQARELHRAFARGDAAAVAEVTAHYHEADPRAFALHHAQLVLARAYGFESWPKLKAFVDGVTVRRLVDTVRSGDIGRVRALLERRPELARMSVANLQVLHHAVLARNADMVRVLMAHGANARDGVYPHREATTAHAIAVRRGYAEIVQAIEEEEQRERDRRSGLSGSACPDSLFRAIARGSYEDAAALIDADPSLVRTRGVPVDVTPLHVAAQALDVRIAELLLDRGADASAPGPREMTPLDLAAHRWHRLDKTRFAGMAALLLNRGAGMTAAAAAALGDLDWLQARHAEGRLTNPIEDSGGLLRIAVTHDQPRILEFLLRAGFDPDERLPFTEGDEPGSSWGMPLQACASAGKYDMAETLLRHGADPNARIYASGDPVFSAYSERDWTMIALLERYGGIPTATTAGLFRQTDLARRMLRGDARYRLDGVGGDTLAEQLLWGAACGGDPEIVRLALERVDWPRDDPRWFTALEQPLRTWTHGSGSEGWPRDTYLHCFRLILERCDPNLRGRPTDEQQFGLTVFHSVAAKDLTAEERVAFAAALLDAGARTDIRDSLLNGTVLDWAGWWNRTELIELLRTRSARP